MQYHNTQGKARQDFQVSTSDPAAEHGRSMKLSSNGDDVGMREQVTPKSLSLARLRYENSIKKEHGFKL